MVFSGEHLLKNPNSAKNPSNPTTTASSKSAFSNFNSPQVSKVSAKTHGIAVAKVPGIASVFLTLGRCPQSALSGNN